MAKVKKNLVTAFAVSAGEPLMAQVAEASETSTRRNRAGTIDRTDKYANIKNGMIPYSVGRGNNTDIQETAELCQKAYFNFAIVRNIIDLMTEFSVGDIYFQKGNKANRDFFDAWMKKINMKGFQDKFYREYYRSGNNFTFRFDAELKSSDISKITQVFGFESKALSELNVETSKIPVRYIMLNPADIKFAGNISFSVGEYFKVLSDYELARLKNPKTDEDKEVLESLPSSVQKDIAKKGIAMQVLLPLDADKVTCIFYKKQCYEPFAVPMIFPVLEDLNFKAELKKLDMAIARTQQQVVLLITTGAKPEEGGINQKNLLALQSLFENESVGRVLIADYTTEGKFLIPDISALLSADKYEELDKDINLGLNNILVGGEKFANQSTKIEVFLARLQHGREIFLQEFLVPEIRRIAKSLGFKNYPIPYYEDITLKNNDLRDRIFAQLAQLGILTPEETVTALETGRLPDAESSVESQTAFKALKDKGLYEPLIGGKEDPEEGAGGKGGRPVAKSKGVPQTTKKVTKIGGKEGLFSVSKLIDVMKAAKELNLQVEDALKLQLKKKKLSEEQISRASAITDIIIANETPENWESKILSYLEKPVDTNIEKVREIEAIAAEHGIDPYLAGLLHLSKTPPEQE